MTAEFDQFADNYRGIINDFVRATGESFEYFIQVRVTRMKHCLQGARLPSPRTILDFGCGIGATASVLSEVFPEAQIVGLDTSGESIRAARSLGLPRARFEVLEPGELPLESGSVDLVYSNGTFHHIPHAEHPGIFRELLRVGANGAQLFVFENNPFNPLMVREMHRSPIDRDARMVFPGALGRSISEGGWHVNSTQFYVFFPRALAWFRRFEHSMRRLPLGAQYFVWGGAPDRPAAEGLRHRRKA